MRAEECRSFSRPRVFLIPALLGTPQRASSRLLPYAGLLSSAFDLLFRLSGRP